MATRDWDATFEAEPADGDNIGNGASEIREHKLAIRERMVQGGHTWQDTTNTNDGKHTVGADGSSEFNIYKSDKTTKALTVTDTYVRPHSTVEMQNSSGDPLTRRRRCIVWSVLETLQTGSGDFPFVELDWLDTGETAVLVEVRAVVKTAPVGAAIKVDLQWSPAANSNPSTGLASVFSGVTRCEIAAGAYKGNVSSFGTTTFNKNDCFLPVIDQVGSTTAGADLTLTAVFEWPA